MRADRRDANEKPLLRIARQCGAWLIKQPPGAGFDYLMIYRGGIYIIEFKDGSKPPSARKLTASEQELKEQCEARNVPYHVIENEEEFLKLLGVK